MLALVLALAWQPANAFLDAGVELANRGQFAAASDKLVQALALNPKLAEAHYLLGLIRQTDGRRDAALASFRQAALLDPRNPAAQARICEVETHLAVARESGYDQAIAHCRRALQLAPGDAESHYHLGRNHAKRGNHAAAITSFVTARRLDPKLPGVAFELALAYLDSQNPAVAIPLLRELVTAEPANGNARFQLGAALAKQGDCAGAVPQLEAATPSAQKHFVLAGCYAKLGREEDARRERELVKGQQAASHARTQARFQAAIAQKKAAASDLPGAIAAYRSALEFTPADLSLKIDLAVVLLKHGDRAAVRELLAGEADPLARYQVALAAATPAEALALLEAVVRDKPAFVEAWYQLGVTRMGLQDFRAAESAFAQAVALRGDDPVLRHAWAEALAACGRPADAAAQRRIAGAPVK